MTATHHLFVSPLWRELENANTVLIAGAGGGFDIYAGLPLYFALKDQGKTVHLANLSFTYLGGTTAEHLGGPLWRVNHHSTGEPRYFPEQHLASWLAAHGFPSDVYAFEKVGVRPMHQAYARLVEQLKPDALVLVDGGTDILMRGDEAGLGTPAEDMTSLAATRNLPVRGKYVSCVGFGIDAYHGVCHAHFLENVASLERAGGFLGVHSAQLADPAVQRFQQVVEHAHAAMPERQSIVNGSILSALEGRFGDHHRTARTSSSTLFINPLMTLYWHFHLDHVARHSLYLDTLDDTQTVFDVQLRIEAFRHDVKTRARMPIPG